MRLDFGVLWIDDHPANIASQETGLKARLRSQGFDLRVSFLTSVADARSRLKDSVFTDHVDLILVDYDLGSGPSGGDALREIRRELPYREIVFYSGRSTRELKKIAYDADVEGVYCATREDLLQVASDVVESMVKRGLDLDHSRGIVLGATCDIDHVVIEALKHVASGLGPEARARLLANIADRIDESLKRLSERAARAKADQSLEVALEVHDLVTSKDRLRLLMRELKADRSHAEARKKIGRYIEDVLPHRNIIAHVRMLVLENGDRVLRSSKGEDLTRDRLNALRRELLDHRDAFETLLAVLRGTKA